jgi:xylan 1,4-beta-xylosidase
MQRLLSLLLAAASAAASSAAAAAATTTASASFTVDASAAPGAPLSRVLLDSFGSSHAATTLRATWRSHFLQVLRDVPFKRVRFHGFLDDDMSAYMAGGAYGGASGGLIFDTLDFFVANGITPTVELSYMPAALALDPTAFYRHYSGLRSTYASQPAWRAFVSGLVRMCIDRYGNAVVRSWRFEVWNEPNCNDLLPANGCCPECGPHSVYYDLYKQTALAIKAADPLVQVGGPATAMLAWIPEFTAWCAANGAPIDFVSSHVYPTDPQLPASRDNFMAAVANATQQAAAAGLPFLLTEFNAGLGSPAAGSGVPPLLDSSFAPAFLLHQHLLAQSVANLESMSFWTFTDFGFEEQGVDPTPWSPGTTKFGIMTNEGVAKPSYRGMQLISQATGDATLPVAPAAGGRVYAGRTAASFVGATEGAVDVSVTVNEGVVTALLASFNCSTCAAPAATSVTLTFAGLKAPLPTSGTLELIDGEHANPMATWAAAGAPVYSPRSLVFAQLAASELAPQPLALAAAGGGAVAASFTLQPFAVARLRFVLVAA